MIGATMSNSRHGKSLAHMYNIVGYAHLILQNPEPDFSQIVMLCLDMRAMQNTISETIKLLHESGLAVIDDRQQGQSRVLTVRETYPSISYNLKTVDIIFITDYKFDDWSKGRKEYIVLGDYDNRLLKYV